MAWLRDPLWIFLLIGIGLFWLDARQADDDLTVTVAPAEIDRLTAQWQAQTGRLPVPDELDGLFDQYIEEEVYYREARKLNLDRNDTIIRRRLVQKLTFLTEDLTTTEPTEQALRDFFAAQRESYRVPRKYSFRHVYFSRDRRENAAADARAALAQASAAGSDPKGDPFMLQTHFAQRSERDIASTFGTTFAASIDSAPLQQWSPPLESAYGWHLVFMHSATESYLPELDAVRARVANDYLSETRNDANAAFKAALLEKYRVERP